MGVYFNSSVRLNGFVDQMNLTRKLFRIGFRKAEDDLIAFLQERMLPVDEIEAGRIAEDLLKDRPEIGYLTISNALQWRLQYRRVIDRAGEVDGIDRIR